MLKPVTTASIVNNSSEVQTYLEPQMINHLKNLFKDESKYIEVMANLWRIRDGFCLITDHQENPNPVHLEMRFAVNNIIGCLLPQDMSLLNKIELKANTI